MPFCLDLEKYIGWIYYLSIAPRTTIKLHPWTCKIWFTLTVFLLLSGKKEAFGLQNGKVNYWMDISQHAYWISLVLTGRDHTSFHAPNGFSKFSWLLMLCLQEFVT